MRTDEYEASASRLVHRKEQMIHLIEFRPHWVRIGPCSGGKKVISAAGDVPCPCTDAESSCRLHSLSPREFSHYSDVK